MGAYDAVKSLDLRIPQDISIVGFDNQEVIAAYLYPPLSTVALPHYEMGQWAVNYLLSKNKKSLQHTLPCPFVSRASVQRLNT
jgi:LacI family transcriptional regulator